MALQVNSVLQQLSRLSVGVRPSVRAASTITRRQAIRRHLTTESNRTVATSSATAPSPAVLPLKLNSEEADSQKPDVTGNTAKWPDGHGDRIWFFHHILDGLKVFSLKHQVQASKKLRTLPFNGKKLKPSKFRKDYWEPYAMIEFPQGHSQVGLSVYHMLREASFLHDHAWDRNQDSITKCPDTNRTLDRIERGRSLNRHMMPNSIADIAGVLGGLGKGNKIWTTRPTDDAPLGVRVPATVYWSNLEYKEYASEWPDNVTHIDAAEWLSVVGKQAEGEPMPLSTREIRDELAHQ